VKTGPAQALRYYEKLVTEDWDRLERPIFADLLRRVSNGNVDKVIIYALDRFSRDSVELLLLEILLRKYETELVMLSQGGICDTSSPVGKMMFRMLATMSEMECDLLSERTAHAMRVRKETMGAHHFTRPRVGWTVVDGKFKHSKKWKMVEQVHGYHEMGKGYQEITDLTGVPTSSIKSHLEAYNFEPPEEFDGRSEFERLNR